jgi:hypothetical protein
MNKIIQILSGICFVICSQLAYTQADKTQMAVWVNEAIIATYTYDYKAYLQEQKEIAKYFSAAGWIAFTKALDDSKLPEAVQKNNYYVSAVATQPPEVTAIDSTHWKAIMPILVVYKNSANQQQQNLKIIITFTQAASGLGVRGYSIDSLQSTASEPPCQCKKQETMLSEKVTNNNKP